MQGDDSKDRPRDEDRRSGRGIGGQERGDTRREVDETLDRVVSEVGDRTPEYTRKAKFLFRSAKRRMQDLDERTESYSQRIFKSKPLDSLMEMLLKWRKTVFAITVVFSLLIGFFGIIGPDYVKERLAGNEAKINLQAKIRGDFEVYLPGGSDAEKVLFEMKKNWSTDLASLFIETNNKFDPTDETNVTSYSVLKEISDVEEALNPDKEDKGKKDGVLFCFSISTLIKTLYNSTNSVESAFIGELPRDLYEPSLPDQFKGNYSIPQNQRLIDEFFYRLGPDNVSSLVADINGDGIYDSALVLMGLSKEVDQDVLIDGIDDKIAPYFVDPGIRPGSKDTTGEWNERYENGEVHCRMTLTGPTPLARMISERTMLEMQTVLPWAIAMVAAALLIFHRTWKIWIVTLLPLLFSLLIAFGMLGIFIDTLTPQVVLVAPILIALGVSYGLYIANRYAEESQIEDREERIRYAIKTTGTAIFLSAATTAFGFLAMLTVDMATMQVLGFGLSVGIMSCYAMTILMTPSLVIWLNYRKVSRGESESMKRGSKKIAAIPIKNSRKIIFAAFILVIISTALSPSTPIPFTDLEIGGNVVQANMDYISLSPADEPVVQKMKEQSDTFGSGQMGLMIVRGQAALDGDDDGRDDDLDKSMKDKESLNTINRYMLRVNGDPIEGVPPIENCFAFSVVDIMQMVKIPDFRNSTYYQQVLENIAGRGSQFGIPDPAAALDAFVADYVINRTFWDVIQNPPNNWVLDKMVEEPFDAFILNIFYNSLGIEIRGMLVNDDYSKTIIYITMPNMDIIETERTVDEVDAAIEASFGPATVKEVPNSASPLSGFGKVLVTINDMLLTNSNQSTIIAIILNFLLLFIFFRSWRIAGLTLVPVTFVVLWQYIAIWGVGFLGLLIWGAENNQFSGDLNLFSALIGSITVGTGVDFSIHITQRIRQKNFALDGPMWAAETSGWSFIEATTTMIMGLTAVFLVNIPSIREFILLIMILLAFSAYGAIFILTSIYRLYLPRYNRLRAMKKKK